MALQNQTGSRTENTAPAILSIRSCQRAAVLSNDAVSERESYSMSRSFRCKERNEVR